MVSKKHIINTDMSRPDETPPPSPHSSCGIECSDPKDTEPDRFCDTQGCCVTDLTLHPDNQSRCNTDFPQNKCRTTSGTQTKKYSWCAGQYYPNPCSDSCKKDPQRRKGCCYDDGEAPKFNTDWQYGKCVRAMLNLDAEGDNYSWCGTTPRGDLPCQKDCLPKNGIGTIDCASFNCKGCGPCLASSPPPPKACIPNCYQQGKVMCKWDQCRDCKECTQQPASSVLESMSSSSSQPNPSPSPVPSPPQNNDRTIVVVLIVVSAGLLLTGGITMLMNYLKTRKRLT